MQDTVYLLLKVEDDGSLSYVSEHGTLSDGIAAGKQMVEVEDFDYPYSLHTDDGCRVATFGKGRIGLREWMRRTGRIHAQEDRLSKDVDEMVGVGY